MRYQIFIAINISINYSLRFKPLASDILLKRLRMIVEAESVNIRGAIFKGNIYIKGIIIMKNYRKKKYHGLGENHRIL